jgi:hypothetical protein
MAATNKLFFSAGIPGPDNMGRDEAYWYRRGQGVLVGEGRVTIRAELSHEGGARCALNRKHCPKGQYSRDLAITTNTASTLCRVKAIDNRSAATENFGENQ